MKRMRNLKGFTLIELIVVILILGILAAIAVVGYTNITDRANETAVAANAKQVATGLSASATLEGSADVNAFLTGPALKGPDGVVSADDYINVDAYLDATYPSVDATYNDSAKTITIAGQGHASDKVIDLSHSVASVNK